MPDDLGCLEDRMRVRLQPTQPRPDGTIDLEEIAIQQITFWGDRARRNEALARTIMRDTAVFQFGISVGSTPLSYFLAPPLGIQWSSFLLARAVVIVIAMTIAICKKRRYSALAQESWEQAAPFIDGLLWLEDQAEIARLERKAAENEMKCR